jgi:hypothetical protein
VLGHHHDRQTLAMALAQDAAALVRRHIGEREVHDDDQRRLAHGAAQQIVARGRLGDVAADPPQQPGEVGTRRRVGVGHVRDPAGRIRPPSHPPVIALLVRKCT